MGKKILLGILALVALILITAIALPFLYKDELVSMAKTEANNNLNATVDFGEFDVSLFTNFPDFTFSINDVTVDGIGQFEGVRLAEIGGFEVALDLMSVISGDQIQINRIGLRDANLHVIILSDGTANYDIAKETESGPEEEASSEETPFSLGVQTYYLSNVNLVYDDRQGDMYAKIEGLFHEGNGDFTQDDVDLKTETQIASLTYKMDGIAYLNRTRVASDFDMKMNMPSMRFDFGENSVKLNALELQFAGWLAMPPDETGEPMDMDLTFGSTQTDFLSILSLVPAIYMTDFEDIKTEGSLALSGMAKGRLVGDQLPAFNLDLVVADAMFQYPDLPKKAENIAIDLHISNPGGSEDQTVVDLKNLHAELAENPIDMKLLLKHPMSDPLIDASIRANLNLESLADCIPLEEGQGLKGTVTSDIQMAGRQSALDNEQYDQFTAKGQLVLLNFEYTDPELPYTTLIRSCYLKFSPQFAELSKLEMQIGESDISAVGRLDNILSWYASDAALKGSMTLNSQLMNLNEFMTEDEVEGEEVEDSAEESTGAVEVPEGIDMVLNSSIAKVIYDNIEITNLRGMITVRDQRVAMSNVSMNMMKGSLMMSGHYDTKNLMQPTYAFQLNTTDWDVPMTFASFVTIQKMAPIMEKATGRFSSKTTIAGALDANMDPLYNTITGKGGLTTTNVKIDGPESLSRIADAVKYDAIRSLALNNTNISYEFVDGRIEVKPFDFKIGPSDAKFSGSHGFDQTLDYTMNLDIPTTALGGAANQAVAGLFSAAGKAFGKEVAMPESVKMDVLIGGTSDNPKITPRLAGTAGTGASAKDQALDELNRQKDELEAKAKEAIDSKKQELENKAKAEADKAKAEIEAKKKAAEEEAKRKAEEAKKKAEAEAKKAAEEAKKKAAEEAKGKVKDLFKK